jgi:hypothetical protein
MARGDGHNDRKSPFAVWFPGKCSRGIHADAAAEQRMRIHRSAINS